MLCFSKYWCQNDLKNRVDWLTGVGEYYCFIGRWLAQGMLARHVGCRVFSKWLHLQYLEYC